MRTLFWTLALAWLTSACASRGGAVPRPFPVPGSPAQAPQDVHPAPPPIAPPPVGAPEPDVAALPGSMARPLERSATFDFYALVGTALGFRGTPYRNGGSTPEGFDCSGFTQYVFSRYGISLPRDVRAQYQVGTPIDPREVAPGDLVFFNTTSPTDVSHVAIAIGGDEFVHAPSSRGVVRVEHISSTYWSTRYAGARRVN